MNGNGPRSLPPSIYPSTLDVSDLDSLPPFSIYHQSTHSPIVGRLLSLAVIAICLTVLLAEVGLYAGESSVGDTSVFDIIGYHAPAHKHTDPKPHPHPQQPVAILARHNHDPAMPPGRLIVLNLFYITFIGYVMLFALSQVRIYIHMCVGVCGCVVDEV